LIVTDLVTHYTTPATDRMSWLSSPPKRPCVGHITTPHHTITQYHATHHPPIHPPIFPLLTSGRPAWAGPPPQWPPPAPRPPARGPVLFRGRRPPMVVVLCGGVMWVVFVLSCYSDGLDWARSPGACVVVWTTNRGDWGVEKGKGRKGGGCACAECGVLNPYIPTYIVRTYQNGADLVP
jgi:hypothetical protein